MESKESLKIIIEPNLRKLITTVNNMDIKKEQIVQVFGPDIADNQYRLLYFA